MATSLRGDGGALGRAQLVVSRRLDELGGAGQKTGPHFLKPLEGVRTWRRWRVFWRRRWRWRRGLRFASPETHGGLLCNGRFAEARCARGAFRAVVGSAETSGENGCAETLRGERPGALLANTGQCLLCVSRWCRRRWSHWRRASSSHAHDLPPADVAVMVKRVARPEPCILHES